MRSLKILQNRLRSTPLLQILMLLLKAFFESIELFVGLILQLSE